MTSTGEAFPSARLRFFAPADDRRDDHLRRARMLLERAIRQRWAEIDAGPAPLDGSASAALRAEIEGMLRPSSVEIDPVAPHDFDPGSPVGRAIALLGLRSSEADLLALLLACEVDPVCAKLAIRVGGGNPNVAGAPLTVEALMQIVYRPRSDSLGDAASLIRTDLAPDGAARRLRFVIVGGVGALPFLSQTVRLDLRFVDWLLGHCGLDPDLAAHARLLPPNAPPGECDPDQVARAQHAFGNQGALLVLRGMAGAGRELLMQAAAHQLGHPLLLVSGRGLSPDQLVAAFREATLHGALLAFRDALDALGGEGLARLRECLDVYRGTVALFVPDGTAADAGATSALASVTTLRPTTELALSIPPHGERLRLWRAHLPSATSLTDPEWKEIAALYNLGVGGIYSACARASDAATRDATSVSRNHVARAVRQIFDADLATVARRLEVSQTWDDVVLPEEVVESLVGLVDRVAFRNAVLGDWGFGRKVGKGLGLTALFSGQPGTGKSMVAGLIARELGLDLYVIDLSRIVSKWLGETEKNLARAFDAAEPGHVLLLFDEADSVLGKRTMDVRSANDRHANLETNFILARLEQFHGIAVFTTNIPSAVDPAIMRRMSAHIAFPFPDVEARAELWRRMMPAEAPVETGIDFIKLAREYELSGGYIRNVVLRAAYMAARDGGPIGMRHLERAARSEYGDRGALTIGGRLA